MPQSFGPAAGYACIIRPDHAVLHTGSFDDAVHGADFVFHTASPFVAGKPDDPEAFFVKPAVEGTKNVLGSVLKSKGTLKRVVLTSSFAGNP